METSIQKGNTHEEPQHLLGTPSQKGPSFGIRGPRCPEGAPPWGVGSGTTPGGSSIPC